MLCAVDDEFIQMIYSAVRLLHHLGLMFMRHLEGFSLNCAGSGHAVERSSNLPLVNL